MQLRAFWYMFEVAAQLSNDIGNGCVLISWGKFSTVFDFPPSVYDRVAEFEKCCMPIRFVAAHSCCPSMIMCVMRPILLALTDKRMRTRTLIHNVQETEIFDALISYGITKDMLPTEMGGTVPLNQREWMANRIATEMEEIT